MADRRTALQPLAEAESSYGRLRSYETPAQLAELVAAVWRAVDRSLRLLVRSDAAASDELRLHALDAASVDLDRIITHLRRSELLSLEAAGAVHEFARAAERVAGGSVRAADADLAALAYEAVRDELRVGPGERSARPAPASAAPPAEREDGRMAEASAYLDGPSLSDRRRVRRLMLFAAAIFFVGGVAMVITMIRGPRSLEREAVTAFREERFGVAERGFRALVERDPENATALLYLGRIYRRQGRMTEAAEVLQTAATRHAQDADVRRELGHLFMDLNRPAQAAQQFQHAVELDPEQSASWIALIQALRAAEDPAADDWLRRAPANVRAALTPAPPQRPFGSN